MKNSQEIRREINKLEIIKKIKKEIKEINYHDSKLN